MEKSYQFISKSADKIEQLVKGLQENQKDQILLGVTGSGKTFTVANIVEKLQKNNSKLEYIKPPDWVGNFDDWHVWVMEYRHGVPWQKHKELNDAYICIENKMLKAYEEGNDKEGERLHLQVIKLGNELADYTQQYLNFKK